VVSQSRYRRVAVAVLCVLVLGGIYGIARITHPTGAPDRQAATEAVAVSTAIRACSAPGSSWPTAASVALAAVPGSARTGTAVVRSLSPVGGTSAGQVVATDSQPGVLQVSGVPAAPPLSPAELAGQPGSSPTIRTVPGSGGVIVSATGAMAQGLEVEQTGSDGLATAQCSAPGTSFWFVGPGQSSAGTIELYLTNTGNSPADAQVQALTDVTNGPPVLGNADNGITVPPHGMVVQSLTGLLQASKVIALNVSTTVGQVVASVRESQSGSQDGIWLPATQAPAQRLVIPGLPGAAGTPYLYVAVPGTAPAMVKITAITQKGSYAPTGGTGIDLLGGSVTDIPLPSLGGVAGAVSISASAPITATMVIPGGPAGGTAALAASSGPVLEQGVLAANPAGATWLVLSAPGKAASVRIAVATTPTSSAKHAGQVVHIPARSSIVMPVAPPAGSSASQFAFVVTPLRGSGPVFGGRIIGSGGNVVSILPVPSSLTSIPLPSVSESLSGIVGS